MRPPGDTREALLDSAEQFFGQRGYAAVGIRDIVDNAGVNIAAIKYHFGSKSGLYLETVRRAMKRRPTAAAWDLLREKPRSRQDAATALVRFTHEFLVRLLPADDNDVFSGLILREAAEPSEAIDSVVRDFIDPHESLLVGLIEVLVPGTPRPQLSLLAQSVLGQILHYRVFRPFLERMAVADFLRSRRLKEIADHIASFSLRALGCSVPMIDRAIEAASPNKVHASPGR